MQPHDAIYFVDGGSVLLSLPGKRHDYQLRWISIDTGEWGQERSIIDSGKVTIAAPGKGGWIAAVVRQ